jgi:hypothetical protein
MSTTYHGFLCVRTFPENAAFATLRNPPAWAVFQHDALGTARAAARSVAREERRIEHGLEGTRG